MDIKEKIEEVKLYIRDTFFYGLESYFKIEETKLSELEPELEFDPKDSYYEEQCLRVINHENGDEMLIAVSKTTGSMEVHYPDTDEFMEILDGEDFWRNFYMINRR